MHRFSLKSWLALGITALGATSLPGCADNDSMMFIIGVAERKAGSCTVKADSGSVIVQGGTMDRLFASDYTAALLIGNQITERGSREQLRTETSRVALKGAEVKLETINGTALVDPFSSIGTGFVDAASGTDPALSVMFASLVPPSIAAGLPEGTIMAKVRVFGTTLGGQDVESSELNFPIQICDGCLISYPADARDVAVDGTDYVCKVADDGAGAGSADRNADLPCTLGIDLQAPCTVCSGTHAECQRPDNNCYYNPDACP
jgi:hypothetical protein